jgi:eukaryotic-like serine/threonine-protein kinase
MGNVLQPQDIINNKYQIISLLGEGGMAKTYSAFDLNNNQKVAIKVVSFTEAKDWKILELFEREAKILATLNHPFIPYYLDYFYLDTENNRTFYLIQELIEGNSLGNLVKQGWRIAETEIKDIAIQILEILNYLHNLETPVIHRDIKPQNIICSQDGKVFLVDFGAVTEVYQNTLNYSNTFVGTMGYMAPEQLRGQATFSSDLYSLGTTLLFLITHRPPSELSQVRMKFDLSKLSISPQFSQWLNKILQPIEEDRFSTVQEALNVLQGYRQINVDFTSQHHQPKGTKIKLKKTPNLLKINIPLTVNYKGQEFIFGVGMSAIFGIGFIQILLQLINGIPGPSILSLIFLSVPTITGLYYILKAFDNVKSLEINHQNFKLKSLLSTQNIIGKSQEITIIDLKTRLGNYDKLQINIPHCLMRYHGKNYYLGNGKTKVELLWLQEEISNFLNYIQLDDFNFPSPHYLKGSRILFSKNSEELTVNIPPEKPLIMIILLKIIANVIFLSIDISLIQLIISGSGLLLSILALLITGFITILSITDLLWSINGKTFLKINREELVLRKTCLFWRYYTKIKTKNIYDFQEQNSYNNIQLNLIENVEFNRKRKVYNILSGGSHEIENYEVKKLVHYINQFLEEIKIN